MELEPYEGMYILHTPQGRILLVRYEEMKPEEFSRLVHELREAFNKAPR